MPLNIELKPNEKIFINGAVLANGPSRAQITVLNDAAILREKDIYTEQQANTPCKRVYLAVQCMYMDPENAGQYQAPYQTLAAEVQDAAPSTQALIGEITQDIAGGRLYQALKVAKKLIEYEQELLKHAGQSS